MGFVIEKGGNGGGPGVNLRTSSLLAMKSILECRGETKMKKGFQYNFATNFRFILMEYYEFALLKGIFFVYVFELLPARLDG